MAGSQLIALGGQVSFVAPFVPSQPARRGVIFGVGGDQSTLDQHLGDREDGDTDESGSGREGGRSGRDGRSGREGRRERGGREVGV